MSSRPRREPVAQTATLGFLGVGGSCIHLGKCRDTMDSELQIIINKILIIINDNYNDCIYIYK